MKFRYKILLALILAGILPIIPLVLSVRSSLQTGIKATGINEIGSALWSGLQIALDEFHDREKDHSDRLSLITITANGRDRSTHLPIPTIELEENELLFASYHKNWYQWNGTKWFESVPPKEVTPKDFEDIPMYFYSNRFFDEVQWQFIRIIDENFRKRADAVRVSYANWALNEQQTDRLISTLVNVYIITYIALITFSLLAVNIVMMKPAKRIEQLRDIAIRVARGNENLRADPGDNDELGHLATSFNTMLDKLSDSRKNATEMEKKAAWRELARILAHEIKNPLTPIQLSVRQLFDSYDGDDAKFYKMLSTTHEIVDEEVESLRKLVREFSDFARAPQVELSMQNFNEVIQDLSLLYSQNLEVELKSEVPEFPFDREKIKRALINLIDNALFAGGEDQPILLTAEINDNLLKVSIDDNGSGVPPEKREAIFEPHYTTKRTGMGLGLPIVRTVVEQHSGSIICSESSTLNGASFRITIPVDS